jgi:hypothetical protein
VLGICNVPVATARRSDVEEEEEENDDAGDSQPCQSALLMATMSSTWIATAIAIFLHHLIQAIYQFFPRRVLRLV